MKEIRIKGSNETTIVYCELGAGAPLIVSSAFGLPFEYWRETLEALAQHFRVLFPLQRGLWGRELPVERTQVTVRDHADDIVALVDRLDLSRCYMLGHCSGVAPLVESLPRLRSRVAALCCVSTRYRPGSPIQVEPLLARAAESKLMYERILSIALAYGPPAIRTVLRRELSDHARLAAHLRAIASARAYGCAPVPAGVSAHLVIAEHDPPEIRQSALEYLERHPSRWPRLWDVPEAGHFFLQDSPQRAAELVVTALSDGDRRMGSRPSRARDAAKLSS
jgi:pimeloyl-ACP methyl ester carboxylesterase